MRIVHVVTSFEATWGGPPRVAVGLAAAQSQIGHSVVVVGPSPRQHSSIDLTAVDCVLGSQARDKIWAGFSLGLLAPLWVAIRATDVVHVHELWSFPSIAASVIAAVLGRPYVITLSGCLQPDALRRSRWKKWVAWSLQRRLLERASWLHAFTDDEATNARRKLPGADIRVIPNGTYAPDGRQASGSRGEHVLYLGRIHPIKNVEFVLEIAAHCNDSRDPAPRFVIAGTGEPGYVERLHVLAGRTGLSNVEFVGHVDDDAKRALLQSSICLLAPSSSEGMSLSVLEAIAHGVPPVVSSHHDIPGLEAVFDDAIQPLDPSRWVDAIGRIQELSPRDRGRLGDRLRDLAQERYSWKRIANKFANCYENGSE